MALQAVLGPLQLVYIILLISIVNTNCQCQLGNSNTETGHALVGESYKSFTAGNYSECLTECVRSTGCKSLNFLLTNRTCELNSETKNTRPDLYVRRENSIYTTKTAYHLELMWAGMSTAQSPTAHSTTTDPPTTQPTTQLLSQSTTTDPLTTQPTPQSPSTQSTTTDPPTTQPTTQSPSQSTTTDPPTTQPTPQSPSTQSTTTGPLTNQSRTTQSTTTDPPTTQSATTQSTTTDPPTTQSATTQSTTTDPPTTQSTTTQSTTTDPPTTQSTTTQSTTTNPPTTQSTTTQSTTTDPPTTQSPTTRSTTTDPPTSQSPTTKSTTTQAAQVSYPRSCFEILRNGSSVGDGVYSIDPTKTGIPMQAYCDMTTDGGGWTIIKRTIFQTSTPPQNKRIQTYEVISEFNSNDLNIFPTASAFLDIKNTMGFHQIHYFCHKQSVGRVVNIRTRNNTAGHQVVRYFTDDEFALTNFVAACDSFDRLPEDTSVLGQNCAMWNKNTGTWGKSTENSRTLTTAFYIKGSNTFGCSVNPPKVDFCACDDDHLAPLTYNPQDRWQISVR